MVSLLSLPWPKRLTFETLLTLLNAPDLSGIWGEDETIGWVYQFFNSGDERKDMRDESQAPRNSRELAVRNQFFTPRYVVRFLTDNTLGRLWLEARILEALHGFAETTTGSPSVRRRLFAGDAAQGVSLIELVRTKFDVVLMNPPYGKGTDSTKKLLSAAYPSHWLDVYLAFIARMFELAPKGYVGALVSRTWMFLSKFEKARRGFVNSKQIACLVDLGAGVLDGATVETSAVVLSANGGVDSFLFGRVFSADDKAKALHDAVQACRQGTLQLDFRVCHSREFTLTPGGALIFQNTDPTTTLEQVSPTKLFTARPGIQTSDDFRFTRANWEVSPSNYGRHGWVTEIFGSRDSRFFTDHPSEDFLPLWSGSQSVRELGQLTSSTSLPSRSSEPFSGR